MAWSYVKNNLLIPCEIYCIANCLTRRIFGLKMQNYSSINHDFFTSQLITLEILTGSVFLLLDGDI